MIAEIIIFPDSSSTAQWFTRGNSKVNAYRFGEAGVDSFVQIQLTFERVSAVGHGSLPCSVRKSRTVTMRQPS